MRDPPGPGRARGWQQSVNVQPFKGHIFKGWGGAYADTLRTHQACGNSGVWVDANRPEYPGWQTPNVDGVLVWIGWASTNNSPVLSTRSAAERDSFTANTNATGNCNACVE